MSEFLQLLTPAGTRVAPDPGAGWYGDPVARPAATETVFPAVSGGAVLEQRGDTLVGLG